jgi:hypothetical protein
VECGPRDVKWGFTSPVYAAERAVEWGLTTSNMRLHNSCTVHAVQLEVECESTKGNLRLHIYNPVLVLLSENNATRFKRTRKRSVIKVIQFSEIYPVV